MTCEDATQLWVLVHSHTRFNRRVVKGPDTGEDYNQRLLYLLAVATFRRVEHLVKNRAWRKLLRVAEAYAEGKATDDQLCDAHDDVQAISLDRLPAASAAAVCALWLLPDDYKVIEGVDHVSDAAGYLAAIEAGVLKPTDTDGASVWKTGAFLAGKHKEERAICALIRDIFGNPFRPVTLAPDWQTPTVTRLARAAYDKRLTPSGELDPARLAVLSDALEDAGCDDRDVLGHLRGPGPHVRGCWPLDLILGKG